MYPTFSRPCGQHAPPATCERPGCGLTVPMRLLPVHPTYRLPVCPACGWCYAMPSSHQSPPYVAGVVPCTVVRSWTGKSWVVRNPGGFNLRSARKRIRHWQDYDKAQKAADAWLVARAEAAAAADQRATDIRLGANVPLHANDAPPAKTPKPIHITPAQAALIDAARQAYHKVLGAFPEETRNHLPEDVERCWRFFEETQKTLDRTSKTG